MINLPGDGIKGGVVEADGDPRCFFAVSSGEVSGVNVFVSMRCEKATMPFHKIEIRKLASVACDKLDEVQAVKARAYTGMSVCNDTIDG